jgi:3-carboxy-cis,cis-muconate cycloisomerase
MEVAAGAAAAIVETLEGLDVDTARMARNIAAMNGVIVSERLSLALATHVGKSEAHALTERLTREAVAQGRSLRILAGEAPTVATNLQPSELDALFDPANALGSAEAFVDRAIATRSVRD